MHHISSKPVRMRSYSMEEADRPGFMSALSRDSEGNSLSNSPVTMGVSPPINDTTPNQDPSPQVVEAN